MDPLLSLILAGVAFYLVANFIAFYGLYALVEARLMGNICLYDWPYSVRELVVAIIFPSMVMFLIFGLTYFLKLIISGKEASRESIKKSMALERRG